MIITEKTGGGSLKEKLKGAKLTKVIAYKEKNMMDVDEQIILVINAQNSRGNEVTLRLGLTEDEAKTLRQKLVL